MTETKKRWLQFQQEVKQYYRKWTIILGTFIFFDSILFAFSIYGGWWSISVVSVFGLSVAVWKLVETKSNYEYLMKKVKKLKQIEDQECRLEEENDDE